MLAQERLKEYLEYDPETGDFHWLKDTNSRGPSKIGELAGCVNGCGYWVISVLRVKFYGHRLAWYFIHGYLPERLDHINGKGWDNRISNLRLCTHAQNLAAAKKEALGYEIHGAKYRARIEVDGIRHELGSFDNPEDAITAYQAARCNLLGEFA